MARNRAAFEARKRRMTAQMKPEQMEKGAATIRDIQTPTEKPGFYHRPG